MKIQDVTIPVALTAGNPILVGCKYKVNAPNANGDWWEVKSMDDKSVVAKSDKFAYPRTFAIDALGEMKEMKQIISESVELVTTIAGKEMWVERIDHWPAQKRRGRKPKDQA